MKQCPVFEDAPATDEFPEPFIVRNPQLRLHLQQRLGFRSEKERIPAFVEIYALHAVSIVEQDDPAGRYIQQDAMELPAQFPEKFIPFLLVTVNQVTCIGRIELVSVGFQPVDDVPVGEIFPGKYQTGILPLRSIRACSPKTTLSVRPTLRIARPVY